MTKEFIPYEIASILKELGFDEKCIGIYYNNGKKFLISETSMTNSELDSYNSPDSEMSAPLYQQAFSFFREKYGLLYNIDETYKKSSEYIYSIGYGWSDAFESYEEAELECLKKLIEICKKN